MAGPAASFNSRLFDGDKFASDVIISPLAEKLPIKPGEDLIISARSQPSDRCLPLAVLHSISSDGVLFKLEPSESLPTDVNAIANTNANANVLLELHSSCIREFKTAIVLLEGGNELHLVAMVNCNREQCPCFWVFQTPVGLYHSCLSILNMRCLALVFDLDETLIVANTMRSFEDRMEALDRKIRVEVDLQKVSGMSAELKRYQEDRALLKQFIDHDRVWDSASEQLITARSEVVPSLVEGNAPLLRPIIRLQERNIIFTRINPNIRDTSVLVRLRPAWDDLRSYLTAKGRKRFEVFVCTMAEKDYAFEMWRLLDPDAQLINVKELVERVVCVKSGGKKALGNVFSRGHCHPKMAMVIDDRLKVWEDRDQSRVHVVPAFAPYYAPQAEVNSPVPILCVARNVACHVRGGFYKDFDEGFTKKMSEIFFDSHISMLPNVPDVNNYLFLEGDEGPPPYEAVKATKEFPDSMIDTDINTRLKPQAVSDTNIAGFTIMETDDVQQAHGVQQAESSHVYPLQLQTCVNEPNTNSSLCQGHSRPDTVNLLESLSQCSLAQEEEGEVPESELDPDTRRRLLILQHGQDTVQPCNAIDSSTSHLKSSTPGGWLGAEEETYVVEERYDPSSAMPEHSYSDNDDSQRFKILSPTRELQQMFPRPVLSSTSSFVDILQEIAHQCKTKLAFKSLVQRTKELQFLVEVIFGGAKIGEGIGKTKKEATQRASEKAMKYMASQFVGNVASDPGQHTKALAAKLGEDESTQRWNSRDPRLSAGLMPTVSEEDIPVASASKIPDSGSLELKRAYDPVFALKKWCTMEGLNVLFRVPPMAAVDAEEVQVEVSGQIVAKCVGPTWEAAKLEAAEEALTYLKSVSYPRTSQKRMSSLKSSSFPLSKRSRAGEYMRGPERMPSSPRSPPRRYARNGPLGP